MRQGVPDRFLREAIKMIRRGGVADQNRVGADEAHGPPVETLRIRRQFTQGDHQPFGFNYSFESQNYAKNAGDLLLVRPRVIRNKSLGFLETKEPRNFAIELEEPTRDTASSGPVAWYEPSEPLSIA